MVFSNAALLYREAKALAENGFEVDVIDIRKNKKDKNYQCFNGINLYHIQTRPFAENNMKLYFFRIVLFFLKSTLLLTYWGVKKRYTLIHVTTPPDIMVFAAFVPKLLGAKIILDIHDIGPELFMRKLSVTEDQTIIRILKFFEKISSKFADHVITVTDIWKNRLVSRSVSQTKCTVILNVPDTHLFRPLPQNILRSSNNFNLYYHGSLEEHFGVDTLINAMPIIKRNIPDVKLHIYGGGRLDSEFKALARKFNMDGVINFYDKVPFYELPRVLMNADIGIVPTKDSVFSDEAVSMKSLEYISLGIPIVISNTKAHRLYYNSSMVKFFEPNNKYELAKAVISLYQDEAEKRSLVCNSHAFLQTHGWNQSKKIYHQIVYRLISDLKNK